MLLDIGTYYNSYIGSGFTLSLKLLVHVYMYTLFFMLFLQVMCSLATQ